MDPKTLNLLTWCFKQNFHADHMNAAIHMAAVRYSPITFRLAEAISEVTTVNNERYQAVYTVMLDKGLYEEDMGR